MPQLEVAKLPAEMAGILLDFIHTSTDQVTLKGARGKKNALIINIYELLGYLHLVGSLEFKFELIIKSSD